MESLGPYPQHSYNGASIAANDTCLYICCGRGHLYEYSTVNNMWSLLSEPSQQEQVVRYRSTNYNYGMVLYNEDKLVLYTSTYVQGCHGYKHCGGKLCIFDLKQSECEES